jgi:hypothetical protein
MTPRPGEDCRGLPVAGDRPPIVALGLVCVAEAQIRLRVQDGIPFGRRERKGAPSGGEGLVIGTHDAEIDRQSDRDLSQPTQVVGGYGEGLGLA